MRHVAAAKALAAQHMLAAIKHGKGILLVLASDVSRSVETFQVVVA
jgi:ribosomal protein L7Ae-like RNA K-turn-binding protein